MGGMQPEGKLKTNNACRQNNKKRKLKNKLESTRNESLVTQLPSLVL